MKLFFLFIPLLFIDCMSMYFERQDCSEMIQKKEIVEKKEMVKKEESKAKSAPNVQFTLFINM